MSIPNVILFVIWYTFVNGLMLYLWNKQRNKDYTFAVAAFAMTINTVMILYLLTE